jgi:xanthine dehydrogenase YagS FAD-binding subunit
MQAFEYASPKSLKEAVALLGGSWTDAAVLAGGTDLLSLMKDYTMSPKRVVNIKDIKELSGIGGKAGAMRIGAAVTLDELASDAKIRSTFPSLHQAAMGVASPQIRNMGTVGGDLCQRPRCWYFRQGHGLLAMHSGKSLVENGENKYHAIFSSGPAKFVSASSLGPALVALGAKFTVVGPSGARSVDAAKFFVDPKADSEREIDLKPNEILTEIIVPMNAPKNATYEVRHKDALDWPLVTASVALGADAVVVLGHVATTPHIATAAGQMLKGQTPTAALAEKAGEAAVQGAKPLSQNAYKVHLAKVAVKRAILAAAGIQA